MRALVTTALELVGMVLIVAGSALIAPAFGVVAAGAALLVIGVTQA